MTHLTDDDRQILAEALLLWRYVNHTPQVPPESEARTYLALKLAKRLGLADEYFATLTRTDVLSIAVKNLDAPPRHGGGRKRNAPNPRPH